MSIIKTKQEAIRMKQDINKILWEKIIKTKLSKKEKAILYNLEKTSKEELIKRLLRPLTKECRIQLFGKKKPRSYYTNFIKGGLFGLR